MPLTNRSRHWQAKILHSCINGVRRERARKSLSHSMSLRRRKVFPPPECIVLVTHSTPTHRHFAPQDCPALDQIYACQRRCDQNINGLSFRPGHLIPLHFACSIRDIWNRRTWAHATRNQWSKDEITSHHRNFASQAKSVHTTRTSTGTADKKVRHVVLSEFHLRL